MWRFPIGSHPCKALPEILSTKCNHSYRLFARVGRSHTFSVCFFFLIQTLFFVISHLLPPHRPMQTALRKVYPYYFTFTTFTKGRWVGEKILDVFAREFRAHPAEEYERCINAGTLTVNYEKVPTDYRLKHNDLLANVVHRFVSIASYGRKTFFVFILFLVFILCVCFRLVLVYVVPRPKKCTIRILGCWIEDGNHVDIDVRKVVGYVFSFWRIWNAKFILTGYSA